MRLLTSYIYNRYIGTLLLLLLGGISCVHAQERKVQHRPYIDMRRFHYGFFVGGHNQSFATVNNAYIETATGRQWFAVNDRYDLGFQVGVLGEWKLSEHFALRFAPSIYFGNTHLVFRDQGTGDEQVQNMKTTYIAAPLELKFSAPRYNNYRPYLLAGLMPTYDLTRRSQDNLFTKPSNLFLEVGAGCDIYLPFFKLIPEVKFCFGLLDVLQRDRTGLVDQSKLVFTESVSEGKSQMVVFTFYFE